MSLLSGTLFPGMGTASESVENECRWGPNTWYLLKGVVVVSTATDSGATPTTDLRPGLLMGKVTASNKYGVYSGNNTDGTGVAEGILFHGLRMVNPATGSVADQMTQLLVAGPVKGGSVFGIDQQARAQMFGRFIFDDDLGGNTSGWKQVVAKAADYTVLAADNNTIFTNLGAAALVTFTLPTIAKGLRYRFYSEDNDGIKILSAVADTLVTHNDVAADSIAFSTTGRNIGGAFEIYANSDATKWLVFPFIWNVADDGTTVTKATITT